MLTLGVDSYVTLAEADSYVENNYMSTSNEMETWSGLQDSDKEVVLRQSCLSLNNLKYTGSKQRNGQKLAFPRMQRYGVGPGVATTLFVSQFTDNSLVDQGGSTNEQRTGISVAKDAQIENAIAYVQLKPKAIQDTRERRLSGLTSKRAGSIAETYDNKREDRFDNPENGIYSSKVKVLLKAWLTESVYAL